jgi:hypothetical protein
LPRDLLSAVNGTCVVLVTATVAGIVWAASYAGSTQTKEIFAMHFEELRIFFMAPVRR